VLCPRLGARSTAQVLLWPLGSGWQGCELQPAACQSDAEQ